MHSENEPTLWIFSKYLGSRVATCTDSGAAKVFRVTFNNERFTTAVCVEGDVIWLQPIRVCDVQVNDTTWTLCHRNERFVQGNPLQNCTYITGRQLDISQKADEVINTLGSIKKLLLPLFKQQACSEWYGISFKKYFISFIGWIKTYTSDIHDCTSTIGCRVALTIIVWSND